MIPNIPLDFGKIKPLRFFSTYLLKRWYFYVIGFASIFLTNLTEVIIPKWLQYFLDYLQTGVLPSYIAEDKVFVSFAAVFAAFLLIQVIFRGVWRISLARESHYSSSLMKELLWRRLRFLPHAFFARKQSIGNIMSIATSDIGTARFLFGFTLVGLANSLFLSPLALYLMYKIDKEITYYTVGFVLILPILVYKLVEKYSVQYEAQQKDLGKLNEQSSSSIANIKLQKLSSSASYWFEELRKYASRTQKAKYKTIKTSILFNVIFQGAPIVAYIFLYTIGLQKLINDQLTIGEFVALQSYVFLLQMPFADIGFIVADYKKSITSLKRIMEILNTDVDERFEVTQSPKADKKAPIYKASRLSFRIENSKIINDLSFELQKGEWLGIKGNIGSGKSTLLELLLGFHARYEGELLYKGHQIRDYSMQDLRSEMAYVPQKNFLFADSLANNLSLQNDLSEKEILHFLAVADLSSDTQDFKQGTDSLLGEDGVNLSGGQKQRLSIARAIAQNKKILIMDDCLSAVDTITEEKILLALKKHLTDTTIIWTAHRDSTLKYCDQILELK